MIEKKYILDKKTLTFFKAYIEPQHEWSRMRTGSGEWVKVFNDINPKTGERTGKGYEEDCIFGSAKEGKKGLIKYIEGLVSNNHDKINQLRAENLKYLELIAKLKNE